MNHLKEFQNDSVYTVLTISNTGEIRARPAVKGNNPASWTGDYFSEVSPADWFTARTADVVFSSIDLWKGCIAIVPREFDHGLVTKEFPIYEVIDDPPDASISPDASEIALLSAGFPRDYDRPQQQAANSSPRLRGVRNLVSP